MFFIILLCAFIDIQLMAASSADPLLSRAFEGLSDDETIGNGIGVKRSRSQSQQDNKRKNFGQKIEEEQVEEINLPWNVTQHIQVLAKKYVEHCESSTLVKIPRNYGLGPLLGLSKSHRHKNKTVTRTLAWVAAERDKAASLHSERSVELADYKINLALHDEIEEIKTGAQH